MRFRNSLIALLTVTSVQAVVQAAAQTPAQTPAQTQAQTPAPPVRHIVLVPKPVRLAPFEAPNRPRWKLADLLADHAGQKSWSQVVVRDPAGLMGTYIQMAPGEKSPTLFHSNTMTFWIVQAGQVRVTIDGVEPFVAGKGFIVQVPSVRNYSMETVGDVPSLRFEVTHTTALPVYAPGETPVAIKGQKYSRVGYYSAPAGYDGKRPYVDFYKDIVKDGFRGGGFVHDDYIAANINYGKGVPRPPDSDKGHFHIGSSEFWFVLDGRIDYQIEGVPFFTADQGDIVYAPAGRWHRATFNNGTPTACRVSIHPVDSAMQAVEPDQDGGDAN